MASVAALALVGRIWREEKHAFLRRWALILVSAAVIASWQPAALLVTLALAGITLGSMQLAANGPDRFKRLAVNGGIVLLVLALVGFKYVPWLASAAGMGDLSHNWLVPLGLSFTVFRLIGVILDSQALRLRVTATDLLSLTLFFPTFRSGPITTSRSLQAFPREEQTADAARAAVLRILFGLFRKVVLADTLQSLVISPWLGAGIDHLTPVQCALLPLLFGLHVYWDFSGYTDMAIGLGALVGFRVPENFNRPYLSRNLVEFWNRWHITLSEWIRTRLFMKMVGRRSPKWWLHGATIVSMALCGLWHGAGLNFLAWGVWHGVGIVAVRLFGEAQRRNEALARLGSMPGAAVLSVVLMFSYVTLGWVVFFLPLDQSVQLLVRALGIFQLPLAQNAPLIVSLLALAGAGAVTFRLVDREPVWASWPSLVRGSAVCCTLAVLVYLLFFHQVGLHDFIYAQF